MVDHARLENSLADAVYRAQPLLDVAVAFGALQRIEHGLRADALLELVRRILRRGTESDFWRLKRAVSRRIRGSVRSPLLQAADKTN